MDGLSLFLLGPPQIELGDRPLTFPRRKTLALLIYLAVTGTPQRRDTLATLLWPDSSQSQARASLSRDLSILNSTLGQAWLAADRETVSLNHNPDLWLDVAQFQQQVAQPQKHGHPLTEICAVCLDALTEAANLYRGDFLSGFTLQDSPEFDDWQLFQAERLRWELVKALAHLAQGYAGQAESKTALAYAQRWVNLDPLHEPAQRCLIQLYAQAGDRTAALRQYQTCAHLLQAELGLAPSPETIQLYETIRTEQRGSDISLPEPLSPRTSAQDWSEVPDIGAFYGRQAELATLEQWLVVDRYRLVAILGMGGVGKSALAAKVTQALAAGFEYVIWRSLLNAPPFEEILRGCLQFLSVQQITNLPNSLDEQLALLLQQLRRQRCLIVLDNLETILQSGERAGYYRPGYEAYGQLIRRVGESKHQSCLLLTSRERPRGFVRLEEAISSVCSLQLAGLKADEGQDILKARGLSGSAEAKAALIERYSGNPLALRLVSQTIHELFEDDVAAFLTKETPIFDDIRDVLDQQFARLPALEWEIMIWLAIEREAISPQALGDNLVGPKSRAVFLEALRSLQRRSLVEKSSQGFSLQNVVIEYTTERLITQICREIETRTLDLFISHALMKAQAKEYVRQSQIRLILQPLAERLVAHLGQAGVETRLKQILAALRMKAPLSSGYAGGNILNLLLHLRAKVRGYDFSGLTVWQAYLRGVTLPEVNFTGADLTRSVFNATFGFIYSVAFSPDGQLLAVGTGDGEIHLWQVTAGQPAGVIRGYPVSVWSVAFSPDGEILAGGGADQIVRLWNIHTGQCLNTLYGHTQWISSVVFSPDGQTLASGSEDQTIRLWDVQTGQCLDTLHGHIHWVRAVAFSPDGETLASGSEDQTVRLWDVQTRQCLNTLLGHTNWVTSIDFSPDGCLLVSGSEDQTVRLWDVHTGQCLNTLHGHTHWVRSVTFSPDGETLASGGSDQTVRLWDVHTGQCLNTLHGHTNHIMSIAFSPDGETLASGGDDQTVRLWDVHAGQCLNTLHGYTHCVRSATFSSDGEILASGGDDQTIHLWNVHTGQCLNTLHGHTHWIQSVAFSPNGETLASGGADRTVRLWDVHTGQCLNILYGHTNWVTSIAFSPDGETLASGSEDQAMRLWDVHTGQCLNILYGHTHWVQSIAFSPDGETLASGGSDQTVRLWDVHTGQCLNTLHEPSRWVLSVAFSPDGETLASGGSDQTVRLWDVHTGQCLNTLHGHTRWVRSITFSPDGETLASGSADETIKLWNMQTGACLKTLCNERPYESMNITRATGLTEAQKAVLKALGAVEE